MVFSELCLSSSANWLWVRPTSPSRDGVSGEGANLLVLPVFENFSADENGPI